MKADEFAKHITGAKQVNGQWSGLCPAHDDTTASLSFKDEGDRLMVNCFAGCSPEKIMAARGLTMRDLFNGPCKKKSPPPTPSPLTVDDLATAKHLPAPFLRTLGLRDVARGVEIPYLRIDGTPARAQLRKALTGKDRFEWLGKKGDPTTAYTLGLDQAPSDGFTFIVEGASDVWTLRYANFHGIGLPGANTAKKLLPEYVKGIDTLYIVREPDQGGDTVAKKIAPRLREIGWSGTARIITADDQKDISALWLDCDADREKFIQRLQRAIDAGEPMDVKPDIDSATTPTKKPIIVVGAQGLAETAEQAWIALKRMNDPPVIYRHGDILAKVARNIVSGAPCLRVMTRDRMAHRLARVAEWVTASARGFKPAFPQPRIVADMLVDDDEALPVLSRIATVPTFTADGRLLEQPGFDTDSGILYFPPDNLRVPTISQSPTTADVERARELILEVVHDFPFVGEADRAAAVAALISGFARELVGNTPLIMFNKPTPRTGASLLTDAIAHIVIGAEMPKAAEAGTEEEWRKRITSILLETPPFVVLDNLRNRLDSGALSSVLTTGLWSDRVLGVSRWVTLSARCVWLATANNPKVSTELAGRIVSCRMDAKVERPGKRTGFLHEPLLAWVKQRRGDLIWASCTLIRAWLSAGRPAGSEVMGGYESWCQVVGGILNVAGIQGLLTNQEDFYARADDEGRPIREFLMAWWKEFKEERKAVKELLPLAEDVLDLGDKSDHSKRVRLGMLLRKEMDRRYTLEPDLTIELVGAEDPHTKGFTWRLSRGASHKTPQPAQIPHTTPQTHVSVDNEDTKGLRSPRSLRSLPGTPKSKASPSAQADPEMQASPFSQGPLRTPQDSADGSGLDPDDPANDLEETP